ncbi:MAG: Eco57I restriction-modification methylase domain-containing protein [Chitinophagaceae bacterium]
MKFNVIVGNPPYQMRQEKTSDNPIYHLFMDLAHNLSERAALITPVDFFYLAAKLLKTGMKKCYLMSI